MDEIANEYNYLLKLNMWSLSFENIAELDKEYKWKL